MVKILQGGAQMNYDVDFNSKVDMNKHEARAEKAMDAVKRGDAFISQVKEDNDGNKHFFNVYGPTPDKLDHICNIFIDSSSLSSIFKAVAHGKLKSAEKKDINNQFEGSQTTIDYTDEPIMWVLKITKEKVYLDAYQRDEKKAFGDPAIENEWDKGDGVLQITEEKILEDNYLFYAMVFGKLRNHLEAEGLIDKLRELNKYSGAGILVSAIDEDNITARIVQGKSRPDLPCEMFLMGTVTCRPYLDEMIAGSRIAGLSMEDRIKAAENGDQDAMESLATAYLQGNETGQDLEKSFKWWKKLAEDGSVTAQYNTGLYYAKGCGVSRSFEKAAEWMQKAADNGDEEASNAVKAYKTADENLKKAHSGDAVAQAELSQLYMQMGNSLEQFGVDNDYEEAFKWAQKSANQGNVDGLYLLGLCYEHGRGTAVDYEKSNKAYESAAKKGHAPSQWNLACHYLRGFDGKIEEGLILAYQAADQGYELAINGLEESGNTVSKIKEFYEKPENVITLESTQYEGRADRCERIHEGDKLTYKIVKDKRGEDALELFYNYGSVGLVFKYAVGKIIALLKMNRIKLDITVQSCIPKSKRGARARIADVKLKMSLSEIKPETPEEKRARLEREQKEREALLERKRKERKAQLEKEREEREAQLEKEREEQEARKKAAEKMRKAYEERKRLEEETRKAEEEAKAKAEAAQKDWEEEVSKIKLIREDALTERLSAVEENRKNALAVAEEEKNNALFKCEKSIDETRKAISNMEEQLSALGFFAFGKKAELKKSIDAGKQKLQELETKKIDAVKEYEVRVSDINKKAATDSEDARPEIEKEYPIPDSPAEKERKKKEEEARLKAEEEARVRAEAQKRMEEAVLRREKSELDKLLSMWRNDSKRSPGDEEYLSRPNRDPSDFVDTVQIRLDIFDFYIRHEGQNLVTARNMITPLLEENHTLALGCVRDMSYEGYLEEYRGSNNVKTARLTPKGQKFLKDYHKFYGNK